MTSLYIEKKKKMKKKKKIYIEESDKIIIRIEKNK